MADEDEIVEKFETIEHVSSLTHGTKINMVKGVLEKMGVEITTNGYKNANLLIADDTAKVSIID
jgi:hypothetical protein